MTYAINPHEAPDPLEPEAIDYADAEDALCEDSESLLMWLGEVEPDNVSPGRPRRLDDFEPDALSHAQLLVVAFAGYYRDKVVSAALYELRKRYVQAHQPEIEALAHKAMHKRMEQEREDDGFARFEMRKEAREYA